jgi:hypothetical protein
MAKPPPRAPKPDKDANTDENGDYIVGKNRPPESGKFKKGDGRPRGRRPKGTANLDTDVAMVAAQKVRLTENGRQVTVSKQHAVVRRLFDKAFSGDVPAIREVFNLTRAGADRHAAQQGRNLPERDQEIIDAYLKDRFSSFGTVNRRDEDNGCIESSPPEEDEE